MNKETMDKEVTMFDGTSVVDGVTGDKLTIKAILIAPLLTPKEGMPPELKIKCFVLASRISSATDSVDLTAEDITLLKDRICDMYPPLIVGRALEILDPAALK